MANVDDAGTPSYNSMLDAAGFHMARTFSPTLAGEKPTPLIVTDSPCRPVVLLNLTVGSRIRERAGHLASRRE